MKQPARRLAHPVPPQEIVALLEVALRAVRLDPAACGIEIQDEGEGYYIVNIQKGAVTIERQLIVNPDSLGDGRHESERWEVLLWQNAAPGPWEPGDVWESPVGVFDSPRDAATEAVLAMVKMDLINALDDFGLARCFSEDTGEI